MPQRLCLVALCLFAAGCNDMALTEGFAQQVLLTQPVRLDGEQVVMSYSQFDCGVKAELWDVEVFSDDLRVGHLTQLARNLQFADDVRVETVHAPSAQIHGAFRISAPAIHYIHDDGEARIVEAKAGPIIDHACFGEQNPPFLMGIRKGDFSAEASPRFRFQRNGDWAVDRILH